MGYSWGIHGVFICIGYVSGMYRVCVGKVSKGTGRVGGAMGGHEKRNIDILLASSQKSKLSKLKTKRAVG